VFWLHCRTDERANAFSFELGAICHPYDNRTHDFRAVERTDYFYANGVAILLHC